MRTTRRMWNADDRRSIPPVQEQCEIAIRQSRNLHKDRRLTSLFGVVEVRAPRFGPCRCGVASRRTITPAAEIMPDRCTPEYERTLAKMGALLPYRRARSLLDEFFPLGDAPEVETIRQRTMRVGARLERDAAALPRSTPTEAGSIALAIDGGHVKSVRSYLSCA